MKYNRTVAIPETTFVAGGTPVQGNLPTNPLSHLVMQLRFLNNAAEATLANILAGIANIEVLWNGQGIVQLNGADLFRLLMHLHGQTPIGGNQVATDNAARFMSLIIPFSHRPYMKDRGLPATKSGQLLVRITPAASTTNWDGGTITIEAVEMLGANPTMTMKSTTLSPTIPATGDNDIDIPREGKLAGILFFATTVPTGTSFTKSINSVKLLNNNKEDYLTLANWEAMRGEHAFKMGQDKGWVTADGVPNDDNYIFANLEPDGNEDYNLDTDPLNQLRLKVNSGDTNAIRIVPVRHVPASLFSGGS